jgi:hypothetical protein
MEKQTMKVMWRGKNLTVNKEPVFAQASGFSMRLTEIGYSLKIAPPSQRKPRPTWSGRGGCGRSGSKKTMTL